MAVTEAHEVHAGIVRRTLMEGTVEVSAVIHHQEAAHIAEHTVKGMGGQHLFQNLEHDLLLVFAVGADMDIAVVVGALALCRAESPFGMLLVQVIVDLGEVGAGNDPDPFFVAGIEDLAQAVAGQIFTLNLTRMLGRVAGNDTGSIQRYHSRTEVLQLLGILLCVDAGHVDLAQICLDHPPGIALPPMFRRQFLAFWFWGLLRRIFVDIHTTNAHFGAILCSNYNKHPGRTTTRILCMESLFCCVLSQKQDFAPNNKILTKNAVPAEKDLFPR